ncbi:hypothetical protein [Rhizobium sp. S163]|uniref:hypothetical protein n=1 Tax=Rhizobium sp. S163 TaxID=3055039 RepID=UPI0025AA0C5C|nr:hypothetical protein [Rhizobium sp. S163]MDM9644847.1 hypothetical protein [Rhizobium sp. S163]
MDDAFAKVAATAVKAGWKPEEVAAALVELADNRMLSVLASRGVERDPVALRKERP